MTNRDLIRRIESKRATVGDLREYARRVERRADAEPCTYGHFGCALVEGGPCLNESLTVADVEKPEVRR
jgi:hypothetical protein